MKRFSIAMLALLLGSGLKSTAQTKPVKLYTQLGAHRDSAIVTVAEAESIIGQGLKIFDEKKNSYQLSSYIFLFKRVAVTEDEQTGKTSPTSSLAAQTFKQSPLPQNWINQVREQVKPGDELQFADVIVKDAKGKLLYSRTLTLKVVQ